MEGESTNHNRPAQVIICLRRAMETGRGSDGARRGTGGAVVGGRNLITAFGRRLATAEKPSLAYKPFANIPARGGSLTFRESKARQDRAGSRDREIRCAPAGACRRPAGLFSFSISKLPPCVRP